MLRSAMALDVKSLMVVLILSNTVSVVLILTYHWRGNHNHDSKISGYYLSAKISHTIAFVLLMLRNAIPNIVSVNMGNTLLFLGFYLEAVVMLATIGESARTKKLVSGIAVVCIVAFNVIEFVKPNSSVRIAMSSLCVFLILVIPNILLFVSKNSSLFIRWVGAFYFAFLLLLFPRALYAFAADMNILTNSPVQALTFLALVLLLVFSLPAYLLVMKESADKIIMTMARTDYLTGLSNRYFFFDEAQRSFQRLKLDGKNVAFLFLDIDHFKNINDTYGHSFGDTVLEALGRIMHENVRPRDLVCRYGGEEFVAMFPEATGFTAVKVAERIQMAIKATRFPEYPNFFFRVSVGIIAGVPQLGDSLELFISRADSALYIAKNSGRDQIVDYNSITALTGNELDKIYCKCAVKL